MLDQVAEMWQNNTDWMVGISVDIDELKTFLCVADTKNFSRSGELLFVTQSAITARIKSLEKELHCQLFTRSNAGVELTMYGETFLRYAKNAYNLIEEGSRMLNLSAKYTSFLSVGAPDSVWRYNLFPFVPQLRHSNPDVALRLLCEHSATLTAGLLDGAVDLAVVLAMPNHRMIHVEPLWSSDYVLVRSPKLRLPNVPFTPETIHQFPFIQMFWSRTFHTWFDNTYQPNIFPYRIDRLFLYMDLLIHGMGIGFLPRRIANSHLNEGTLTEIPYDASERAPCETGHLICLQKRVEELHPFMQKIKSIFL